VPERSHQFSEEDKLSRWIAPKHLLWPTAAERRLLPRCWISVPINIPTSKRAVVNSCRNTYFSDNNTSIPFTQSMAISKFAIGFRPAFSARVVGITSKASAYAWKQYASMPLSDWEYCERRRDTWISGAPPPPMRELNWYDYQRIGGDEREYLTAFLQDIEPCIKRHVNCVRIPLRENRRPSREYWPSVHDSLRRWSGRLQRWLRELFDQFGLPKFILGESIDVCDRSTPKTVGTKFYFVPFDIFHENVESLQEVEGCVVKFSLTSVSPRS